MSDDGRRDAQQSGGATRVGFISLGCSKNLVDSEVMLGHLDRAGCRLVLDPADADVIVVNTCSFIDAAREESVDTILEAAQLKRTGRLQRLVVAGCLVQRYPEELRREMPEVDAFVNLDELDQIVACVGAAAPARARAVPLASDLPLFGPRSSSSAAAVARPGAGAATARRSPATYLYDDRTPRRLATPGFSAYVKIAEGCDHSCAFCAIPGFRGSYRSRDPESIVREATTLAGDGRLEINLIAQDASHYGRDLGLHEGLSSLLERLNDVPLLRWIRVHYLYPNTVTQALVETMARLPRVVDYVDVPLQHAHPDTLRRMRRGGSAESHLRLLDSFRKAMPEPALRSTFIVGFPGETSSEFEALLDFVRAARFDHLGAFEYSHEQGTPAETRCDNVPAQVKRERRERLMACQQSIAFERNRARVGRRVEVLVEGAHPETEHLLVGRMAGQAPDVDGQVLINDGSASPGDFVLVELTDTAGYDLVGGIVGPA